MAEIVLVHGIDQQDKSAETLEKEWLPALASGLRLAGFPAVADRIWSENGEPGSIDTHMAFYGNLFLIPGLQGDGVRTSPSQECELLDALAIEWLRRAADRATTQRTRQIARREFNQLTHNLGVEQGAGKYVRSAARCLAKIPWFAPYGMGLAERFVQRSLTQVTRYFSEAYIRAAAVKSILDLIGSETRVLIGHSLGSVVAYEASHHIVRPLPLLLTLGSPLGLHTIIYDRLQPQPPSFPLAVRRWVNIADPDDFIAADPKIESLFGAGKPASALLEGSFTQEGGSEPHSSLFYLRRPEVGGPVGKLFQDYAGPRSDRICRESLGSGKRIRP
ncbi:MAG: hypothetical protein J2P49_02920 [Methylocapsa sp.]|nr:hypothetical protein [Methylocapsa sp.]